MGILNKYWDEDLEPWTDEQVRQSIARDREREINKRIYKATVELDQTYSCPTHGYLTRCGSYKKTLARLIDDIRKEVK